MAFKVFDKKPRRFWGEEPAIKIRKYGQICANRSLMEKFFKDTKFVELLWDKERQLVGFRPLSEPAPHAFRWSGQKKQKIEQGSAFITAKSFLQFIGLEVERTQRYVARWDDSEGLVVISLRSPEKP
ncbi:MAG TPA: hypothetical protein EYP59_06780 [Thiotrichaceae bacterium]|nr:hypothetical protein [Thiotrichaceae bacterium]